jgi:hypothetical protein
MLACAWIKGMCRGLGVGRGVLYINASLIGMLACDIVTGRR